MRVLRLWLTIGWLGFLGTGCRCERVVGTGPDDLRVVPALDFGAVPVGASLGLDLEIVNGGRSATELNLSTTLPFRLLDSNVTLQPGQTTIRVIFEPVTPGPSAERLELGPSLKVALSGTGAAPCEATSCHEVHFDPDSRSCVVVASADGSSCADACLSTPTCSGGRCIGPALDCDDHDPCTTDACTGAGACTHAPLSCPVTDACTVAACVPTQGCITRPVEDGAPCGPSTCLTAQVCLAGTCQQRTRPGAADDCTYTAISANGDFTCALTVARNVRCWGGFGPYLPNELPTLAPRPAAVSRPFLVRGNATAIDLEIVTRCQSAGCPGFRDGGLPAALQKIVVNWSYDSTGNVAFGTCALLSSGQLDCRGEGVLNLAAPPGAYANVVWTANRNRGPVALRADGSLWVYDFESGWTPRDAGGPVIELGSLPRDVFVVLADGGLSTLENPWPFDAGALVWGGRAAEDCAVFADGGLTCADRSGGIVERPFPVGVTELTNTNTNHACALSGGNVWCWGSNNRGQLGDFSAQLEAPTPADPAAFELLQDAGARAIQVCRLEDGGVWCRLRSDSGITGLEVPVLLPQPALQISGGCALLRSGDVRCFEYEGLEDGGVSTGVVAVPIPGLWPYARAVVGMLESGCAISGLNGVQCWGSNFYGQLGRGSARSQVALAVPLGERVDGLAAFEDRYQRRQTLTVCARLASGRVRCWGQNTFGLAGQPVLRSSETPLLMVE